MRLNWLVSPLGGHWTTDVPTRLRPRLLLPPISLQRFLSPISIFLRCFDALVLY